MRHGKRCCCFRNTSGNDEREKGDSEGEGEREKFWALTASKGTGGGGEVGRKQKKKANTLQPAVRPPLVTISHQPSSVKFIRREDEPYGKKTRHEAKPVELGCGIG